MAANVTKSLSNLKRLDVYSKPLEELRVRTLGGALISLVSACLMFGLFVSELRLYLSTDLNQEIFVDVTRGNKIQINVNISFPSMPCDFLTIDSMDVSGEQHIDIAHDLYKTRLDSGGREIGEQVKTQVNTAGPINVSKDGNKNEAPTVPTCGSCYGAETADRRCCNTCNDVREAYRLKGWAVVDLANYAQCREEGLDVKLRNAGHEGCRVHGHLLVNKVAGNFHFAPGKSYEQSHMHVHDLSGLRGVTFNLSHSVHSLSFGDTYDGRVNPLDGHSRVFVDGSATKLVSYYVKVVPTLYTSLNGTETSSNQYSVTKHERSSVNLPGIFFYYEISPILVRITERRRSFGHFLTSVCAIVGGVFTVASLIDAFCYHSSRVIQQKLAIGKQT
ncbi:hypothetical protein BOX15_Mlig030157g2 [Macrostomum lignano]|uniref:Endoplasmic reticulum-Golgi intermediate compartment protein 3 n=2 Tax=Macrostomum lignano TaxID=282301 RepID=A0A1I8I7G5_9PLAT|nr:hypothetical protein BOX15_Mlig030157g2 [Macrostomum lignano]